MALERGAPYGFLVAAASLHLMRVARPLMRRSRRALLITALEKMERALHNLPDAEIDPALSSSDASPSPGSVEQGAVEGKVENDQTNSVARVTMSGAPWRVEIMQFCSLSVVLTDSPR